MTQMVFSRYEKKYLMDSITRTALLDRISPYMHEDQYGLSTICNIYFDTPDSHLIARSLDHPVYKEKLRMRSYGIPNPDTTVFPEIKKKYRGIVFKRRIALPLIDADAFADRHILPSDCGQIGQEIAWFLKRYPMRRSLYLAYDRIAYASEIEPEFRLTIDRNIRSRTYDMYLDHGDEGEKLLDEGTYLLETKISGSTPLWFAAILSDLKIRPVSFSKYGRIYARSHHAAVFKPEDRLPETGGEYVHQYLSRRYI